MFGINVAGAIGQTVRINTVANHDVSGARIGPADAPGRLCGLLEGQGFAIFIVYFQAGNCANKVQYQIQAGAPDGQVKIQRVAGHVTESCFDVHLLHGALGQVHPVTGFCGAHCAAQANQYD